MTYRDLYEAERAAREAVEADLASMKNHVTWLLGEEQVDPFVAFHEAVKLAEAERDVWRRRAERLAEKLGAAAFEMRLCEAGRVSLKPNTLYRFTVDPECPQCLAAAAASLPAKEGL